MSGVEWPGVPAPGEGKATPRDPNEYGHAILADVEAFVRRFCILPGEHAYIAVTLWAAHTHFVGELETTGRLAALSPEPGSGKTRVLEVLDTLTRNPLLALDLSMSAFFRIVADQQPTVLLDEADAIFTGKSKSEGTEDLRRVINNGYRVGAVVQRVGGKDRDQVQSFPVFTPVAMAGLGSLPDTLLSRSVILRMKRRAPGERVEPWRDRLHRPVGEALGARMAEWASETGEMPYPTLPEGVHDRDADIWEPLVMVADAAGGDWPQRARAACLAFIAEKPQSAVSLGVRLLGDVREVWPEDSPVMSTADLIAALGDLDEAPWADLYGEGLKPRKLAQLLGEYGAKSTDVRTPFGVRKGYRREDLWDAWHRYLSPSPGMRNKGDNSDSAGHSVGDAVADGQRVADTPATKGNTTPPADQHKHPAVAVVADVADSQVTGEAAHPVPPGPCRVCDLQVSAFRANRGMTTCSTHDSADPTGGIR